MSHKRRNIYRNITYYVELSAMLLYIIKGDKHFVNFAPRYRHFGG